MQLNIYKSKGVSVLLVLGSINWCQTVDLLIFIWCLPDQWRTPFPTHGLGHMPNSSATASFLSAIMYDYLNSIKDTDWRLINCKSTITNERHCNIRLKVWCGLWSILFLKNNAVFKSTDLLVSTFCRRSESHLEKGYLFCSESVWDAFARYVLIGIQTCILNTTVSCTNSMTSRSQH